MSALEPTGPFPLQTVASILLVSGLHSGMGSAEDCGPLDLLLLKVTSHSWLTWGSVSMVSDLSCSRGSTCTHLSRSTFIFMQLPAFLRTLTASWWLTSCMSWPLTWWQESEMSCSELMERGRTGDKCHGSQGMRKCPPFIWGNDLGSSRGSSNFLHHEYIQMELWRKLLFSNRFSKDLHTCHL